MPPKRRPSGRGRPPGSGKAGPSAAQGTDSTFENERDIPEVLRALPTGSGRFLAWGLPPMHRLEDIFQDMAAKALELGFDLVLRHLGGRALRVATMCSGTESPLLGLGMIQRGLASRQDADAGQRLQISHLFSCEIVPFKQAYIERNFHPPLVFRDILELGGNEARTAYGSLELIPSGPDILVAGTACVDFSLLNSRQKTLDEGGESGNTFKGMLAYAKKHRPALVIQENVRSAPWGAIARYWEAIGYMARHVAVDTKSYYIPQTRERGYMVCIDKTRLQRAGVLRDTGSEDDVKRLGDRWADLVKKFRRPASSPAGMFLLSDDDRRLDAVEKAITNRTRWVKEVSWDRYQVRHQRHRNELELGNKRPISRSRPGSFICQPPDFYWRVFLESQPERVWETLDLNFLKKLQRGYDMSFKERWIDLSQGIDRNPDTPVFGIVGCLTPCGLPFLTTRGGPLSGLEALSLQGLPLDRMILTRETQRELQDLAGNAMTSTCVSAAILSALIVGHEVLDKGDESTEAKTDDKEDTSIEPQDEYSLVQTNLEVSEVQTVEHDGLQSKAARSAMYCACERQSGVKDSISIVKCILCGHTACGVCRGNPSHSYEPFSVSRSQPWDFISCLKDFLPMRLSLRGLSDKDFEDFKEYLPAIVKKECDWTGLMEIVNSALHDEVLFLDIKRGKDWTVLYEGKYSSLRLIIGGTGLQWLLFAKPSSATPSRNFIREALVKPIARMRPVQGSLIDGEWQVYSLFSTKIVLYLSGTGAQVKSFEAECGLQADKFRDSKVWNRLVVDGAEEDTQNLEIEIRGEYEFLPECGTALGALYRKLPSEDWPAVYLFLDPTKLGVPVNDSFVFAVEHGRIPGYASRTIIAELSHTWRSFDAKETPAAVNAYYRLWAKAAGGKLRPRAIEQIVLRRLHPEVCISIGSGDCHTSCTTLMSISAPASTLNLEATPSPWKILNPNIPTDALKNLAWLVSKVTGWAEFRSWNKLAGWQDLPRREDTACHPCYPSSPKILWGRNGKGKIVPYEDPKDAGQFERAVKAKPAPFLVFQRVNDNCQAELRFTLNIQTLAHQAYGKLIGTKSSDGATVDWRLIPNVYENGRQATSRFRLATNKVDSPCPQPPHFQHNLRVDQLRLLAWVTLQEADDIEPVIEEETEEAVLPLMPWRAEVKVAIPKTIRGGILADEVGFGKTAIILGLIDAQYEKDGKTVPGETGLIPSKATVIIVPPSVYKQWLAEIDKFLGSRYKVLCISDTASLRKKKFHEVQDADIIVVSWTLFKSPGYYDKLQRFTGTPRVPIKGFRNFDDWFQNVLRSLKDVIHTLVTEGPEAFLLEVQARRQQVKQNETNFTYVPSRRLRGKESALANQKREETGGEYASRAEEGGREIASEKIELKEEINDMHGTKKDRGCACEKNDEGEEDTACEDSPSDGCQILKRKHGQSTVQGATQPAHDDRETFNIHPNNQSQELQDWRSLRYPFLHAFNFNRLVIDEYTYSGEERLMALLALQARSKWILSGTPALDDFADIKSIARYFGVHLGVDDDGDVPTQNHRLKSIRRHYTAAENFLMFQAPHSEAWYHHRRETAQAFLDRFARQNTAEIDHIPMSTHLVLINQPPAEQEMYQALYERLAELKGRLMKMKNPDNSPQVSRLNEILSSSQSPVEVLVKCCATVEPQTSLWDVDTCKSHIVTHKKKRAILWSKFDALIRQAATVWHRPEMEPRAWQDFVDNSRTRELGDPETVLKVVYYIKECFETYDDWSQRQEHGPITAKVDERLTKAAKPATRKKQKHTDVTSNDDRNDSENEQPPRKRAKSESDIPDGRALSKAMKGLSTDTARVLKEIVQDERDIRFLEAMLNMKADAEITTCCNCQSKPASKKDLAVLRSCGHTVCEECISTISEDEQCVVSGCDSSAKVSKIIRGDTLDNNSGKTATESCKIKKLIEVIHQVPADELVLVFVQFMDSIGHVTRALKSANIQHCVAHSRNTKAITEFTDHPRTRESKGNIPVRPKVLILNLGTSMAAGLNLQRANHVIFLSPLLVPSQHEWEAGMTQAIGRARRFGQSRQVHVYHLLVKNTIDVNIMQERHGKILVERRGEPAWVEPEEASAEGSIPCAGLPFEFAQ